jgi:hypothetical protein
MFVTHKMADVMNLIIKKPPIGRSKLSRLLPPVPMTRKVEVQRQHPPLECATESALPALVPLPIDDLERHILVRRSGALGVLDTISVIYYVKIALNIIITIDFRNWI